MKDSIREQETVEWKEIAQVEMYNLSLLSAIALSNQMNNLREKTVARLTRFNASTGI